MLYPYKNIWEIDNIADIMKTIFADYNELVDGIIFKIFALSEDKMIFTDFLDKLELIHQDIIEGNIDKESEKLLIDRLSSIIKQSDTIRNYKDKMGFIKNNETNNENIEDIFNNIY